MKFQKLNTYLSPHRIGRYLIAAGSDKSKGAKLYKANLKISQAFHPLLGVLEVILRNYINIKLSAHFTDVAWILNQKTGFMIDPSLVRRDPITGIYRPNHFLKLSVEKAEQRFIRLGIPITPTRIIAEQTLGFWTDFYTVHHYRLLLGKPIKVFNHLPTGHGRHEVYDRLDKIREFRNRINHNEPVCFKGRNIDFSYVEEIYEAIIEILDWIDPDIVKWVRNIDSVKTRIGSAKKI